jgi:hypothetical protein
MPGDTIISILRRIIDFSHGKLTPAMAEAILLTGIAESDQVRMSELASRSNAGTLMAEEAVEYDGYIAAADLLSLWKSKARLVLKQRTSAA